MTGASDYTPFAPVDYPDDFADPYPVDYEAMHARDAEGYASEANDNSDNLNFEAEYQLVAEIIRDNSLALEVGDFLQPDDFDNPLIRALYATALDLAQAGKSFDALLLAKAFQHSEYGSGEDAGSYVSDLASTAMLPRASSVRYAKLIWDESQKRRGCDVIATVTDRLTRPDGESAASILADASEELTKLALRGSDTSHFSNPCDMGLDLLSQTEAVQIPTGWQSVDEMVMLDREAITLLAGHTSMGKSAVAVDMARRVARMGFRVDFFSLEMSKRQIAARMIAAQLAEGSNPDNPSGIPYFRLLRTHTLKDWQREDARKATCDLPSMNVDTTSDLSVSNMIERLSADPRPLDLVIVDYVNIVSDADLDGRLRTDQKIGKIAARLRNLAKSRNCAVLLLCQLNRNSVSRDSKAPELSDLKDSSALEQAADAVIFCHRPEYFYEREIDRAKAANEQPDPDTVDALKACRRQLYIICAKQRNGPTGQVKLRGHIFYNYITE